MKATPAISIDNSLIFSVYCHCTVLYSVLIVQIISSWVQVERRACDSDVSVTFTIHSYQMCQLVSADNFFSFAEQESIFQNKPASVFKADVGRSKADCTTVSTLWPHGRPGHWSHDSKILVCKNQIKGSDHSEWSTSAHIAANNFRSNSMMHLGFQRKMTPSLLRSSSVER